MKNEYKKPNMEVIRLDHLDIITTSGVDDWRRGSGSISSNEFNNGWSDDR